jgi:hypothetical protein
LRADPSVSGGNGAPQYFTTPRTSEYEQDTVEPIFDFGGPIKQNFAWFYVGYNKSVFNQDRTVAWATPTVGGVTYPAIQSFNQKTVDKRFLYNGTVALRQNLRVRFSGNHQRTDGGLALPTISAGTCVNEVCTLNTFVIDADGNTIGTSTQSPATFNPRSSCTRSASTTPTAAWLTGQSTTRRSRASRRLSGSGSGNTGGDYYHGIRRHSRREHRLPRRSAGPAARRELYGQQLQQFHRADNYNRFNLSGDVTRYATGAASTRSRPACSTRRSATT